MQQIKDSYNKIELYWNENQEWLLIPLIVCSIVFFISSILTLLLGNDVNGLVKFIIILLYIGLIVGGFYAGPNLDPLLQPLFDKLSELNSQIAAKLHK